MRTLARISGIFRGWVNDELFETLCALCPAGRVGSAGHSFRARIDVEDEATSRIVNTLEEAGLTRWDSSRGCLLSQGKEYSLEYERIYDETDLAQFSYFEFHLPQDAIGRGAARGPGQPEARLDEPGPFPMCWLWPLTCILVVQQVREVLESSGLVGPVFHPVEKRYESVDYDLYDEEDIWWVLDSELIFPPTTLNKTLCTRDNEPFDGDFSKGCNRREGLYMWPELHYRQSDMEAIGVVDIARTYEMFGDRPAPASRELVVSKRFYDVCREHNIPAGWLPVHIEDLD